MGKDRGAEPVSRDPRSPHSGDKGDADGEAGAWKQMVSIQGAAAEMLIVRKTQGL